MSVVAIKDILNFTSLSEHELSERLHEDQNTVSSWFQGESSPTILQLRKIFNIIKSNKGNVVEVPEVGIDITPIKLIGFFMFWGIIALFFTGFGYLPYWVTFIVFLLGVLSTFNLIFSKAIKFDEEMMQVKFQTKKLEIHYRDVNKVCLKYGKRIRYSPFDFNPDFLYMDIITKNNENIRVDISLWKNETIKSVILFLVSKEVEIEESDSLISLIMLDKNLNENMS